jgi:hypothetical protein
MPGASTIRHWGRAVKERINALGIRGYCGVAVLKELLRHLPFARPAWRWDAFATSGEGQIGAKGRKPRC